MNLSRHEIALALLHAVQSVDPKNHQLAMVTKVTKKSGKDTLAKAQTAIGLAEGTATTNWDTHTPIVNLLQAGEKYGKKTSKGEIYVTEAPSDACLGIAKLKDIKSIYFINDRKILTYNLKNTPRLRNLDSTIVSEPKKPEQIRGLPDSLSIKKFLNAPPQSRGEKAAEWYYELENHWEKLKIEQKFELKTSFDELPTWTAVNKVSMPGVPIAGINKRMRSKYADALFMTLAYTLAGRSWGQQRRNCLNVGKGHNIAAVLASRDGSIHAWGINTNDLNSTRHAETNLIQSLGQKIPASATLYTTLQSCFMCAGLFVRAGGMRCVYGQKDLRMDGATALANNESQATEIFSTHAGSDKSMGQHLESQRNTLLTGDNSMRLVPNFLKTQQAKHTYSYAQERLVNLARAAERPAEWAAWRNIVKLLKTRGLSLPSNLMLDDEARPLVGNHKK